MYLQQTRKNIQSLYTRLAPGGHKEGGEEIDRRATCPSRRRKSDTSPRPARFLQINLFLSISSLWESHSQFHISDALIDNRIEKGK
jgi:hypothetical protein